MKFFPILISITGWLILPGGIGLSSPQPGVAQVTNKLTDKQVTDKIAPLTDSSHPVYQAARSITVRVLVKDNRGSGVLIARNGEVYTVLTNTHVLTAGAPYRVETADGQVYAAEEALVSSVIGLDAALLQFRSSKSYPVAKLVDPNANVAVGQRVWAAGFPEETGNFLVTEGELSLLSSQVLIDGYQLGYSNEVIPGMSGGLLLNQRGEVVGINGLSAYPILDDAYIFMDGSRPSAAQREEMRRLSWAIPVQLALGIAGQGSGGAAEQRSGGAAEQRSFTGVVARVDAIAAKITVRIEGGASPGSGAIVARDGNTYYVATAAHVVSGGNSYQVVTPDGVRYPVKEVKTREAMDLAVVQFTSPQSYAVATLADYRIPTEERRWVFVSGWPVEGGEITREITRETAGYLPGE